MCNATYSELDNRKIKAKVPIQLSCVYLRDHSMPMTENNIVIKNTLFSATKIVATLADECSVNLLPIDGIHQNWNPFHKNQYFVEYAKENPGKCLRFTGTCRQMSYDYLDEESSIVNDYEYNSVNLVSIETLPEDIINTVNVAISTSF